MPSWVYDRIADFIRHRRRCSDSLLDIYTPDHLKLKFAHMPPIFKNQMIERADVVDYMRVYAEERDLFKRPVRCLISSYSGESIFLMTPLIRWYFKQGLVVTKIYEVVEYDPRDCFRTFRDMVTKAKREADRDTVKKLSAGTFKLLRNRLHGKCSENRSKHKKVSYVTSQKYTTLATSPLFYDVATVDDARTILVVSQRERRINHDLSIVIDFFVYAHAKLRILDFCYGVIDKLIDMTTSASR